MVRLPRFTGLAIILPPHRGLILGQTCVNILKIPESKRLIQHRCKKFFKSEQTVLLDPIFSFKYTAKVSS